MFFPFDNRTTSSLSLDHRSTTSLASAWEDNNACLVCVERCRREARDMAQPQLVRPRRRTPDDPDPGHQEDAMLPAWVGADMNALNMPNDLETGAPLVLPAAAHVQNAVHIGLPTRTSGS